MDLSSLGKRRRADQFNTGQAYDAVDSTALAARSTSASEYNGPTICTPTGKPDVVKPQGTVAAGCRVILNG